MVLQYLVQNSKKFAFRERDEAEKERLATAAALLTSFIADADVITDWVYFAEILSRGDDETPIPTWISILQLVSCICGTLSWMAVSSDGRLMDWLRQAVWWMLWGCLWVVYIVFLLIPGYVFYLISCRQLNIFDESLGDMISKSFDKLNAFFDDGFRISNGRLLMLGIFSEDLPQIIVTFLVEDASGSLFGNDGAISGSAYLNLIVAIFDILHKLADAWDTRKSYIGTGTGARTFTGHKRSIWSLAIMGRDRIVSASRDGTARLWNIISGKCAKTFNLDERGWTGKIARLGDDKIITVSSESDGKIKVFKIDSGECLKTIDSANNTCATVSNDGQYFLTSKKRNHSNANEITRWDTETLESVQTYPKSADYLVMLNENQFVSANDTIGEEGHPILWDVTSGKQSQTFNITNRDTNRVIAMCKQHNENAFLIASQSGSHTCIDLFSAGQPDRPIKTMTIEGMNQVRCLTSVGGNRFVVSYDLGNTSVDLWNISSRQRLHTFEGHTYSINDIVYLPEQRSIATASYDDTVKVWSIPNNLGDDDIENQQTGGRSSSSIE